MYFLSQKSLQLVVWQIRMMKMMSLLPICTIKLVNLNMIQGAWINTSETNRNPIWGWAWMIKGSDPTNFAKCVVCSMSPKSVGCNKLVWLSQKLKMLRRHSEMCIPSHGAVWTVAIPSCDTASCFHFPSYSLAVASTTVHYHLITIHSSKTINN